MLSRRAGSDTLRNPMPVELLVEKGSYKLNKLKRMWPTLSLDKKLAFILCTSGFLFSSFTLLMIFLVSLSSWLLIPTVIVAVLCLLDMIYGKTVKKSYEKFLSLVIAFIYLPIMFFTTGGLYGPVPMFFVVITIFNIYSFEKLSRYIILACEIIWFLSISLFSYLNMQNLSMAFAVVDPRVLVGAYLVTMVVVLLISALVAITTIDLYRSEHVKIEHLMLDLQDKNKELYDLSNIDALTEVYNRRYFVSKLNEVILAYQENPRDICLLMMDIDFFKRVNDLHGHSVGDEVLKMFTGCVKRSLRSHDILARYGGEEFVLMLDNCNQPHALAIAERIRKDVNNLRYRRDIVFTVSIGLSAYVPEEAAEKFLERADKYLYMAKENGRNQVCCGPL